MEKDLDLEFINNEEVITDTDLLRFLINIKHFDDITEVSEIVGRAKINVYNALLYSSYDLRMMAQIDGSSFYEYQTLNSVRIFESPSEMQKFEEGRTQYKEEPIREQDIVSFDFEEMDILKGWTHYNEETENVCGVFVTIEDLNINEEYNEEVYFTNVVKQIESFLLKLGVNYLIAMPFPMCDSIENEFAYKRDIKEITTWYEEYGFRRTKGKLKQPCFVKVVNELL